MDSEYVVREIKYWYRSQRIEVFYRKNGQCSIGYPIVYTVAFARLIVYDAMKDKEPYESIVCLVFIVWVSCVGARSLSRRPYRFIMPYHPSHRTL